jgi:hypothetical protein
VGPGSVWTGAENLAPTGIRSPDRPARSQSLYRLRCPANNVDVYWKLKNIVDSVNTFLYGNHFGISVNSGFREVAKIYALLGCYAASSGNSLPTFRDR